MQKFNSYDNVFVESAWVSSNCPTNPQFINRLIIYLPYKIVDSLTYEWQTLFGENVITLQDIVLLFLSSTGKQPAW